MASEHKLASELRLACVQHCALFIAIAGLASCASTVLMQVQNVSVNAQVSSIMAREGRPSSSVIEQFRDAGMTDVKSHRLTASEYEKVQAAIISLPRLNQDALYKRLHQIAFVDGVPGEGTGLTSPSSLGGQYDLTFRASLIKETLSQFLTTKERRVFTPDNPRVAVSVTGTGVDALTYVLLHESSHVLDFACRITKSFPNAFDGSIWIGPRETEPSLSQLLATKTYFHQGPRLSLLTATDIYGSLSQTPFVSLYATSSAQEDFAELVAWREIEKEHMGTLTVSVEDTASGAMKEWHPLTFENVSARFARVDAMEHFEHGCPDPSRLATTIER